jgi:hypothetical protein
MTASAPAPTESRPRGARLRIDDIDLRVVRGSAEGARGSGAIAIVAGHPVTAATQVVLPAFDGWLGVAEVVLRLEGHTAATFDLRMHLGGARGAVARVGEGSGDGPVPFHVELRAPLSELAALLGETTCLSVVAQPVGSSAAARTISLMDLTLQRVEGAGPHLASIELSDITDAELYGASERRSFDLQNPEEGFWRGSGKALLRLTLTWASPEGSGWRLERRLERLSHALAAHGALQEDAAQRRARAAVTETELVFDTGHADLGAIPEEGKDVLLAPEGAQSLEFKLPGDAPDVRGGRARLLWSAPLPVRVRDPCPSSRPSSASPRSASTSAPQPPSRPSTRRGIAPSSGSAPPRPPPRSGGTVTRPESPRAPRTPPISSSRTTSASGRRWTATRALPVSHTCSGSCAAATPPTRPAPPPRTPSSGSSRASPSAS